MGKNGSSHFDETSAKCENVNGKNEEDEKGHFDYFCYSTNGYEVNKDLNDYNVKLINNIKINKFNNKSPHTVPSTTTNSKIRCE